jgi:hypothetical protein
MNPKVPNLILFVFISLTFFSCKKDDTTVTPEEPGANSTGSFFATVKNQDWDADNVKAYEDLNYTYISGIENIDNPNSIYSSIGIYVDLHHLQGPVNWGIGVDGNGLLYFAHARVEYKLKSDGSIITYIGRFVEREFDFSYISVDVYNSKKIEGTLRFRASNATNFSDSLDVTDARFSITF